MTTPLQFILLIATHLAKHNLTSDIICPGCGEQLRVFKWGFYWRYLYSGQERIKIQRYKCCNPLCSRRTFSILPRPLLPLLRLPVCFYRTLLSMQRKGVKIAALARACNRGRTLIRRCLKRARQIEAFLQNEQQNRYPCCTAQSWSTFCRIFFWALFPLYR